MNKILVLLFVMLLVSSCATSKLIKVDTRLNKDEARALLAKGNNTIKGSSLIRTRGGDVVTCAGNKVLLVPATSYAVDRMDKLFGNPLKGFVEKVNVNEVRTDNKFEENEYLNLTKSTRCDAQGFFEFKDVADGEFFITTNITWELFYWYYTVKQGGSVMEKVSVKGGETKDIVLAP